MACILAGSKYADVNALEGPHRNQQSNGYKGPLPARELRQVNLPAVAASALVAPLELHSLFHLSHFNIMQRHMSVMCYVLLVTD
jgi:hypothetical protein